MPKKNTYQRNVSSTNPLAPNITLPGDSGVYGANPAPGLRDYPETKGNVLPPTKFAETDIAPTKGTKINNMNRDVKTPNIAEEVGLQRPGTTKILTGRNRYERNVKTEITKK